MAYKRIHRHNQHWFIKWFELRIVRVFFFPFTMHIPTMMLKHIYSESRVKAYGWGWFVTHKCSHIDGWMLMGWTNPKSRRYVWVFMYVCIHWICWVDREREGTGWWVRMSRGLVANDKVAELHECVCVWPWCMYVELYLFMCVCVFLFYGLQIKIPWSSSRIRVLIYLNKLSIRFHSINVNQGIFLFARLLADFFFRIRAHKKKKRRSNHRWWTDVKNESSKPWASIEAQFVSRHAWPEYTLCLWLINQLVINRIDRWVRAIFNREGART